MPQKHCKQPYNLFVEIAYFLVKHNGLTHVIFTSARMMFIFWYAKSGDLLLQKHGKPDMASVDEYIKTLTDSFNPHNLALFVHSYMQ